MSDGLARWNFLSIAAAVDEILPCCGSRAWADGMVGRRPLPDEVALLEASDETWRSLAESDWLEAFRSHPRIGESQEPKAALQRFVAWSAHEQQNVGGADEFRKLALSDGYRED